MIRFKVSTPAVRFDAKDGRPVRMGVTPVEVLHGEDGKSAYEIAVGNGFEGTEEEWLDSLKGDPGDPGRTPEKGKDYYTDQDIQDMVSAVLAALPVAEGRGF